jgi:hypothetical protein
MRSRATNGTSALKCQNIWPDRPLELYSDAMECRELAPLQVPGFPAIQKIATIQQSGEQGGYHSTKRGARRIVEID